MSGPDRTLNDLAAALADGSSVDWDAAAAVVSTAEYRERLERLRLIATIANVYREASVPDAQRDFTAADPQSRTPKAYAPGDRWGNLQILNCIGRGTFGDVYRARDPRCVSC